MLLFVGVCCCLLFVCLFVVLFLVGLFARRVLRVACCALCGVPCAVCACCLMIAVRCSLFAVRRSLFIVCWFALACLSVCLFFVC